MIISHFALKKEWDSELSNGLYGVNCISRDGFIQCYTIENIENIDFCFSTLKDYIIICIDTEKIKEEIKFENASGTSSLEPRIYKPIPTDAVIQILPYTFDESDKFTPSEEFLDFGIINKVCKKLNIPFISKKYFHDGTTSRIILLNDEYIIKISSKEQLKAESVFANYYANVPTLQKISCIDEDFRYIVYNFIPGDVMHTVSDFDDLAKNIKLIVSAYKNYPENYFGYIESPVNSWTEFLKSEVEHSKNYFDFSDDMLKVVDNAIKQLDKFPFEKKLIHGDLGTHNFIKRNEKFIAAIDPTPIAGDKSYDLLYALVSNIDLIPFLSINYLMSYLKEPKEKVEALLKIVLFCRIGRCVKYNKEDLDTYLDFWYNLFK